MLCAYPCILIIWQVKNGYCLGFLQVSNALITFYHTRISKIRKY